MRTTAWTWSSGRVPKGVESTWIPTQGKRPLPVIRLYGGDDAFWDKAFNTPDGGTG
ncbi:MAG: hypothetical protein WA741_27675 [Candidatus Sulfotelmatobacter sp.]